MTQDRRSSLASHSLGLGLRTPFYQDLLERPVAIDYLEIISENFMGPAALPGHFLRRFCARYPIVMHGVGLNLLGSEPLDETYLERLCRLADTIDAPFVSDHLCWSRLGAKSHHDLLPVPFTDDLVGYAAERAAYVQRRLGRPFGVENLSSYLAFPQSTLREWDFYRQVVDEADCAMMLDLNNIYVSAENLQFCPKSYLATLDWTRILQVHLAGPKRLESGLLLDTHDQAVLPAVWDLYREAWQLGGPFPTLLEWDDAIPPVEELVAELQKARNYQV